jgi:hypothetical protein
MEVWRTTMSANGQIKIKWINLTVSLVQNKDRVWFLWLIKVGHSQKSVCLKEDKCEGESHGYHIKKPSSRHSENFCVRNTL